MVVALTRVWMITVLMAYYATYGNWGAVMGPCAYQWGGSYLMVGKDTENPQLCAFLMWALSCDTDVLVDIANKYGSAAANRAADASLINGESANSYGYRDFLNGQNPYVIWSEVSEILDQSNRTYADMSIRDAIVYASGQYLDGTFATVYDAIAFLQDQSYSYGFY